MLEQSRDDIQLLSTIESVLRILKAIVPDMDLQKAKNLFIKIRKGKNTLTYRKKPWLKTSRF